MFSTMRAACIIVALAPFASAQAGVQINDLIQQPAVQQQQPVLQPLATPAPAPTPAPDPLAFAPAPVPASVVNQPYPSQPVVNQPYPSQPAVTQPITQPFQQIVQGQQQPGGPTNVFNNHHGAANPAGVMESLLTSITGGQAPANNFGPSTDLNTRAGLQSLGQESMQVVSGLVEAFMHKVTLAPGERSCLENNMGQLTGDIMGTVGDIVIAIKALVEGQGTIKKEDTGALVSAGIDSAMKITSLVAMSTTLMKKCVHGDALIFMKECAHHLTNGKYLEHEFVVNGVSIMRHLAHSIIAFESKDFHVFGHDIGVTLRKILLSNNTTPMRLPEGKPEKAIIQETMEGIMAGFFVPGSAIDITDTIHPDVNIHVDLNQCIAGNSAFFKELWMAAWDLVAQLSMNGAQHDLSTEEDELKKETVTGQPKWSGELMIAMMQVPMALGKCGIGQAREDMLMEAIHTLQDVRVAIHFPESGLGAEQAAAKMAKAVEAWTHWDFKGFGFEIGELFRELVLQAFPQKYSIDASGALTAQLESKASTSSSLVIVSGAAMSVLVAFAVVRTRRSVPQMIASSSVPLTDIEDGDEMVEVVE